MTPNRLKSYWFYLHSNLTLYATHYHLVGRVGVEPTISEEGSFTDYCVCRFATYPYKAYTRGILMRVYLANTIKLLYKHITNEYYQSHLHFRYKTDK